eukprot:scaffold18346_cov145-Amphora_coffeaeformis.AAC.3
MKFTLSLLSLLTVGVAADVPRASLVVPEEELSFGIESDSDVGDSFVINHIRTDLQPKRRLGKSNTAAPTETPLLWFEVDDDDSTVSTLLNGVHQKIVLNGIDCLPGQMNCRGRIRSQVTGTMDGTGCPTLYLAAGSVKGDVETNFGHFTVTCPSADLMATGIVEKCSGPGNTCTKIDDSIEDSGSGTIFRFPAQGVNVIVLVTCCPVMFPHPATPAPAPKKYP